jgi:fibronectin-binding autotransporter adhesin
MNRTRLGLAALSLCAGTATSAFGADVIWDNGASNFQWDSTSLNWGGSAWNNSAGDGAVFTGVGAGAIDVNGPISLDSLNFTVDGYVLNGSGSLNIVPGFSTQTSGVVNVAAGATAKINVGVNSSLGFQKIGAGILELNAPCNFGGPGVPLTGNGNLRADLIIGGTVGPVAAGVTRIGNSSVLPTSTRVSIGNGLLDIGNNNVTIGALTFVNQTNSAPWDPINRVAAAGVIGGGTLRVLGEINTIGVTSGNQSSNTVAANLDLGGGTQVVRAGLISSIGLSSAIQFTGVLSNGSLLKTVGVGLGGVQGSIDGMSLHGNNTYTGSTIVNSGTNIITGTNQTSLVRIAGIPAGPAGGSLTLQGANGSVLAANTVQAFAGGSFVIDNNVAMGAGGNNQPNIPAAQNNNRLKDTAALELRDGNFVYRGLSTAAASETIGSMSVIGGHGGVTLTPNGAGGTVTINVANDLSLASRATLSFSATTLGAASKVFVGGTLPAADATGILPRMANAADFLTYNATTGITPFTGYAADFSTPGTNVAVAAASTVASSVNINALKRSGTFTTTIAAGQTLGIDSGMILNATGTGTFTGGTIAFGNKAGVFLGGTNVINSALTGGDGLINANSTVTLNGDLSGLAGEITTNNGTTTLATNTFGGSLRVRAGTLNLNTSQTLAGAGPITLGVPENDANLVGLVPTLAFNGAGANAVFNRDIVIDNGASTAAGMELSFSTVTKFTPLSNATGSQTFTGDVTLNSPVNLQGGGGGGTGSTNFTGDINGGSLFMIPNGRAKFSGNVSNDRGFLVSGTGFTAQVTFEGTTTGNVPIRLNGGNNSFVAYKNGSLPTGLFTFQNAAGSGVPSLVALENSTINNSIFFSGDGFGSVGAGITATWAGPLSGGGVLAKSGAGTLVLTSNTSTHSGPVQIQAGELRVNGILNSVGASVSSGAVLSGTGVFGGGVSVSVGGAVAPGASVGTLRTGSLSLSGSLNSEVDLNNGGFGASDLLEVIGGVTLNNATLNLGLLNTPGIGSWGIGTYILVANDGADAVSGAFASIGSLPSGYTASVNYAYTGVDSVGRIGDGNDIAVVVVPAPGVACVLGAGGLAALRRRREA